MRAEGRLWVLALTVALLACGDSATQPPAVPISGTWSGQTVAQTTLTLFLIEFGELDEYISGTGILSGATGSTVTVTVRGLHLHPDLSLTLEANGFADLTLGGTVSDSTITAQLSGSGFMNEALTLTKQ